jgi:tetratricopeptide (TPR) repeat protein
LGTHLLLGYVSLVLNSKSPAANTTPESDIKPSTLALLGSILNRGSHIEQRKLARLVTFSASALGDIGATIQILKYALRVGNLQDAEYAAPLELLKTMARSGKSIPAMTLWGKILQSRGEDDEALKIFEQIAITASGGEAAAGDISEVFVQQGRILLRQRDVAGAEQAFRKAALELDNAAGYYHLARLQADDSPTKEVYLLKSASSGVLEACHELGEYQLQKLNGAGDSKTVVQMAREWLFLAARGSYGPSMLALATLNKEEGNLEAGLEWLRNAEILPEYYDRVQQLKAEWQQ